MPPRPPQFIEPERLADEEQVLAGRTDLQAMPRLQALLAEAQAEVSFNLGFSRDPRGFVAIRGEYDTVLMLRCQRCLEPLPAHLHKAIGIGWINAQKDAGLLPADLEPLLASAPRIALADLLEEEVLLGLPMAPRHADQDCPAAAVLRDLHGHRENPFAVLKDLKLKK